MVDPRINISDEILEIARAVIKEETSSLIRVNALAGTGKTTLLKILEEYHTMYWKSPFKYPKVVFLAYSRLLADEVKHLFENSRVTCCTVYELAKNYYIGRKEAEPHKAYSWELFAKYFNVGYSDANQIYSLLKMWLSSGYNEMALSTYDFSGNFDGATYYNVQTFITDVRSGQDSTFMTPEFLLKEFQLDLLKNQSIEPIDLLLVDEGQDLSDAALSVFLHYPAKKKVIVGDTNQKIYDFVSTKNALIQDIKKQNVLDFTLSTSYRHEKNVAQKAEWILQTLKGQDTVFSVYENTQNVNPPARTANKGIICGTNIGILKALQYAKENTIESLDLTSFVLQDLFKLPLEIYKFSALTLNDDVPDDMSYALIEQFNFFKDYAVYDKFFTFLDKKPIEAFKGNLNRAINIVKTFTHEELMSLYAYALAASSKPVTCNSVAICTIHKSKGFEFNSVVIVDDLKDLALHIAEYFISTQNTAKRGVKYDFVKEFGEFINKRETSIFNDRDVSSRTFPINLYYTAITRARREFLDLSINRKYPDRESLNEAIFKFIESAKRKNRKEV